MATRECFRQCLPFGRRRACAREPSPCSADSAKVISSEGGTAGRLKDGSCGSGEYDKFFRRYLASGGEAMQAEGVELLCGELGVSTLDPVTLVIACHCKAEKMGVFSRDEFVGGMQKLGCSDAGALRAKLGELRGSLVNQVALKEVYAFTFTYALEPGSRTLPLDLCIEFWRMLLREHFALLDGWIAFVKENCRNSITRDTWMMLYDLATQVRPDLSDYDVCSAWPVLLDDFVEQVRDKHS